MRKGRFFHNADFRIWRSIMHFGPTAGIGAIAVLFSNLSPSGVDGPWQPLMIAF